jgi:membrane-bound lytic murein transglycosylase B
LIVVIAADLNVRTASGLVTFSSVVLAFRPSAATASQEAPRPSFADWISGVRAEALSRGIRPEVLDEAFAGVEEPLPVVLERDRSQAELVMPLETYIARRLTPAVVKTARRLFGEHRQLLEQVSERYGVPPRMIVAVWGIESNFGRFSGVRPTILALATLAWDTRRSMLFRNELFDGLEILNRGYIEIARMRGSWAGAMGQVQFMPSSYLKFAEDFDGDGRRDIWTSPADIFASIANYLKGHGWSSNESWGREVKVSAERASSIAMEMGHRTGSCQATREMTVPQPVDEWKKLGVRTAVGAALPSTLGDTSMVSGTSRHFLVTANYDALLEYNCAHAYAVSVGLLADKIGVPTKPAVRAAGSDRGQTPD